MADSYHISSLVALPVAAVAMLGPLRLSSPWPGRDGPLLRFWFLYSTALVLLATAGMIGAVGSAWWTELPRGMKFPLSSTCRVLSKGVDLKTAKLCTSPSSFDIWELKIITRFWKHTQFTCYFEYYWASVFEVEFWPKASSLPHQAAVEAPSFLLPSHCRPGFRAAWRKKEIYKINGTYPCRYSPTSLHQVQLGEEDKLYQNCTKTEVSTWKLAQDFFFHLILSDKSILSQSTTNGRIFFGLLSGIIEGVLFSVFTYFLTKSVYLAKNFIGRLWSGTGSDRAQDLKWTLFQVRLQSMMLLSWYLARTVILRVCQDTPFIAAFKPALVLDMCETLGLKQTFSRASGSR